MRVVHGTSVHPAQDNRIAQKECRSAAERGHEVVLVAAHGQAPGIPGVEVVMVDSAGTRLGRMTAVVSRVADAILGAKPDIIHIHDPELLLVAGYLSRYAPVVFDMHEDIPAQIRDKGWIPRPLRPAVSCSSRIAMKVLTRSLVGVVFAEPEAVDETLCESWRVVQNYPRLEEFSSPYERRTRDPRRLNLVYVGGLTRLRGAIDMVLAMGRLPEDFDAVLHLAGPVQECGLLAQLEMLPGWSRVRHYEWLDRDGVARLMGDADIGLVVLHAARNYVDAHPTKLFEYMAAGCAVIGSDLPVMRRIIDGSGCGVVVPPSDPEALADAILELAADRVRMSDLGESGRRAAAEHYSWETEAEKLMGFYGEVSRGRI